MIQSAKISGSGYSVTYDNGDILSVPNADGNRHYNELMKWVDDGNIIGSEFTVGEQLQKDHDKEVEEYNKSQEDSKDK